MVAELWLVVVDNWDEGMSLSQLTVIGTPLTFPVLVSVTTCCGGLVAPEPVSVGVNSV